MHDLPYLGRTPQREKGVFVAPDAALIGGVTLSQDSSVFFQCVLRADIHDIRIGARSNIQDHTTIHVSSNLPTIVGEDVSVGHRCILHACTLGNRILVGMGAIIMDGCEVGDDCIIGAGSLLPKGKNFPAGSLILGSPAKLLRTLTEEEKASLPALANKYLGVKNRYLGI
jgi:carbonic anhydrase/acetyltransferase-like protein (isoleucine patch superfamily)